MVNNEQYLCSDLIRITCGEAEQIGNLESIAANGCIVSSPDPIPVGCSIAMQCVECPQGRLACDECRFGGLVRAVDEMGPCGSAVEIEFQDRNWSPVEWKPRHLNKLPLSRILSREWECSQA